ncbi:MAG: hypothetical protein QOJ42_6289, partial [Acidobacteriaceae bacterium]|nr:hypothetical protein [Acidobacteriaceae bacterium]
MLIRDNHLLPRGIRVVGLVPSIGSRHDENGCVWAT